MRVPIPWVLLLAIAVLGGGWWLGTRTADFLTPPNAAKLALIRQTVESSVPQADYPDDALTAPAVVEEPAPPPPAEPPPPAIELGDLTRPPTLLEYRERAPKGATYLMDLAALLEAKGAPQRALLAWERLLDTVPTDDSQRRRASAAVLRLRPTLPDWNTDHAAALAITLHAATRKKSLSAVTPLLEEIARDLEHASAGILKVTATVTTSSKRGQATTPAPVELWLTGRARKSGTTAVLTCTPESPTTLRDDLLKTLYAIIHDQLAAAPVHTPAATAEGALKPLDAVRGRITRACWQELGTRLNLPPAKHD